MENRNFQWLRSRLKGKKEKNRRLLAPKRRELQKPKDANLTALLQNLLNSSESIRHDDVVLTSTEHPFDRDRQTSLLGLKSVTWICIALTWCPKSWTRAFSGQQAGDGRSHVFSFDITMRKRGVSDAPEQIGDTRGKDVSEKSWNFVGKREGLHLMGCFDKRRNEVKRAGFICIWEAAAYNAFSMRGKFRRKFNSQWKEWRQWDLNTITPACQKITTELCLKRRHFNSSERPWQRNFFYDIKSAQNLMSNYLTMLSYHYFPKIFISNLNGWKQDICCKMKMICLPRIKNQRFLLGKSKKLSLSNN